MSGIIQLSHLPTNIFRDTDMSYVAFKSLLHGDIIIRSIYRNNRYFFIICFLVCVIFFQYTVLYAKGNVATSIRISMDDSDFSIENLQNDFYLPARYSESDDPSFVPSDVSYGLSVCPDEDIINPKTITLDDLIDEYQRRFLKPADDYRLTETKPDPAVKIYKKSFNIPTSGNLLNKDKIQDASVTDGIASVSELQKEFCPYMPLDQIDIENNRWKWNDNKLEREKLKIKEDYFLRDREMNAITGKLSYPIRKYDAEPYIRSYHLPHFLIGRNFYDIYAPPLHYPILEADYFYVGTNNTVSLTQENGEFNIYMSLYLGFDRDASGTYNLKGGLLSANQSIIGVFGYGKFHQTGGISSFVRKYIGYVGNGDVIVDNSARLTAGRIFNGYTGHGTMTQKGNSFVSAQEIYLGYGGASSGTYTISGLAQLYVNDLVVGYNSGLGILKIESAGALIAVQDQISFTRYGFFYCADRARIKMDSARFSISSSNPGNFIDFNKLTLELTGEKNSIEVASQNSGVFADNPNYLFNEIAFSGEGTVTLLLTDYFNNDLADAFDEALYVNTVSIGENTNAMIDLAGLSMYTKDLNFETNSTLTVQNGSLVVVVNGDSIELNGTFDYAEYQEQILPHLSDFKGNMLSISVQPVPEPGILIYMFAGITWITILKIHKCN